MLKKLKTKKYFPATIFIFLISVFAFSPPKTALAGWLGWPTQLELATFFAQSAITITGFFAGMAGSIFELALDISVVKTDFYKMGVIISGWETCRDIANLFFIFIMIYIGLGMILQISGIDAKKMLLRVIVIALLVNFSLPFTRILIDASNIFAMEFVCAITNDSCEAAAISGVFTDGLSIQTLLAPKDGTFTPDPAKFATPWKMLMLGAGGSIILLVATFVFLALAFLFFVRTIVFMVLIVFAPLAYIAMAIPGKAQGYASQWWDQLFNQCLVAPAAMFMLYLTARMITDEQNGIKSILRTSNLSFLELFTDTSNQLGGSANLLIQFGIIAGMLLGSVLVANKMGAYGAGAALSWGKSAKKTALGYAGRKIGSGARRASLAATKPIMNELRDGTGRFARSLRAVPGMNRIILGSERQNRKTIETEAKKLEGASVATLKNIASQATILPAKRAAAINMLNKSGNLAPERNFAEGHITAGRDTLETAGYDVRPINQKAWQYATNPATRAAAIATAPATSASDWNLNNYFDVSPGVAGHNPATYAANIPLRNSMYQNLHAGHIKNIYERDDGVPNGATERFFNNLRHDFGAANPTVATPTTDDLARWLEGMNNRRFAAHVRSNQNIYRSYGFS